LAQAFSKIGQLRVTAVLRPSQRQEGTDGLEAFGDDIRQIAPYQTFGNPSHGIAWQKMRTFNNLITGHNMA
jgi:hypothetical protein